MAWAYGAINSYKVLHSLKGTNVEWNFIPVLSLKLQISVPKNVNKLSLENLLFSYTIVISVNS